MNSQGFDYADDADKFALANVLAQVRRHWIILMWLPMVAAAICAAYISAFQPTYTSYFTVLAPPKGIAGLSVGLSDKRMATIVTEERKKLIIRWSGADSSSGTLAVKGIVTKLSEIADAFILYADGQHQKQEGVANRLYSAINNPLYADTAEAAAAYATMLKIAEEYRASASEVKNWRSALDEEEIVVERDPKIVILPLLVALATFLSILIGCIFRDAWQLSNPAKLTNL